MTVVGVVPIPPGAALRLLLPRGALRCYRGGGDRREHRIIRGIPYTGVLIGSSRALMPWPWAAGVTAANVIPGQPVDTAEHWAGGIGAQPWPFWGRRCRSRRRAPAIGLLNGVTGARRVLAVRLVKWLFEVRLRKERSGWATPFLMMRVRSWAEIGCCRCSWAFHGAGVKIPS